MNGWLTKEGNVKVKAEGEGVTDNVEVAVATQYQPSEADMTEATAAGFSQEEIDAAAAVYDPQQTGMPFVAFLQQTKGAVEASVKTGWLTHEPKELLNMTASQAQEMVVKAFGYTDLAGQLNAAYVLGSAQRTVFNAAISEAWKEHGKCCKERVMKLSKWGAPVSMQSIRDVVAKVLIENKIHAYPAVVAAIADKFKSENPFQTAHMLPDERGDQQPGSKLARS